MTDRVRLAGRRIAAMPEGPLAAAAVLALLAMTEIVAWADDLDDQVSAAFLLALCGTVPLVLLPGQVVAATGSITLANTLALAGEFRPTVASIVAQLLVGYQFARTRSRWLSLPLVLPFALYALAVPGFLPTFQLALVAGAILLGVARRERDEARIRRGSSQAVADSLLQHAARGERARIARELHDVVAHHISLIAVQAETARLTTPGLPPDGARRLAAIGDTARAALTEMRRLLGVLREDAGTEPTRSPQPGLEQLNELIDEARESVGVSTRLIVRGRVGPLDPGIELTAYRIVQEALTNARRHAPGAAVDVELDYLDDRLRLRVRDNGPGPPGEEAGGTGHGLLGMRERVATVGGTLWAGRGPVGGFVVEVVLPVGRSVQ